jgi:pyruvate formate lyase activating enzyme
MVISEEMEKPRGTILRIQRMSTEDGPGIRSTVFFKGCPLSCVWCHNPESISDKCQPHWMKAKCIGCRSCVAACAAGALTATDSGIAINRALCSPCGACSQACPTTALSVYGEERGVEELVNELLKDRVFFEKSGGGVTLSGGEPTMQPGFAETLLASLKRHGIHTALDTCGQCTWETLRALLAHTDLFLYDLKEADPENHRRFTGTTNTRILENLKSLARSMRECGLPRELWIRTPLIPGCTANAVNLERIGEFIREHLGSLAVRWELCTFNNLCTDKYDALGIDWGFRDCGPLAEEEANRLADAAAGSGVDPGIVHISGPMSRETRPADKRVYEADPAGRGSPVTGQG